MQLVTIVATLLAGLAALFVAGVHIAFRVPAKRETGTPDAFGLPFREVDLPTRRGRRLFAWWIPARPEAATVIILHGWGSNSEDMLPLAVPFHGAGFNVLLPDARGHGRSDRDTFASLPRFAEDVGAAMDWVREEDDASLLRIADAGHDSVDKVEEHGSELVDFIQRVGVAARVRQNGTP